MDRNEILRDYVGDMVAVEKHCLESVERQIADEKFTNYKEAHDLLVKIKTILSTHTFALDQYLSSIDGGVESVLKKAATTAAGAISGLYGKLREEPVTRSIRDDYTALNLVAISYTLLHTTTLALNETVVAEMAIKHLNEVTPLIVALSRIAPKVAAMELAAEGKIQDASVWTSALDRTQKAWGHEVVEQYH